MTTYTTVTAWTQKEGERRVTDLFIDTYHYHPQGVWQAPGRVNLIGEHVDYNGGKCVPIALPHRTYAAVATHDDNDRLLRLVSRQADGVTEIDLNKVGPYDSPQKVDGWGAYVAGVLWALEQKGYGPFPGYDIAIDSCVPFGAGLSSSAALECAIAVAVDDLAELGLGGSVDDPDDEGRKILVEACMSAENDIAGANTGGLDQSSSLRCREGKAIMLDCQDGSVRPVEFDLGAKNLTLLVIDTKAPHSLNDGQYASRRNACEQAASIIGVELLADVSDTEAALAQLNDKEQYKRVRHVLSEIERTDKAISVLDSGDLSGQRLEAIAALFNGSHDSLRDDYEVTCPELDTAVDVARQAGAHGARMTGGGFGGSAIAIIDNDKVDATMKAIVDSYQERGFNEPEFLLVTPAAPAGRVN